MPSASALTDLNLDELASLVSRGGRAAARNGDAPFPEVVGRPPLSYAQERLVFMDRLAEGHCFYNLAYGLNIAGDLDVSALGRAWLDVVERHETLRSCFPDDDHGNPCVHFLAAERCSLKHEDLRSLGPAKQKECIEKRVHGMVASPYNLRTGPLARGTVLHRGVDEWTFLYGFHHSIFDGWSQAVFQEELFTAYAARSNGFAPSLSALPVSHGQYALWQRQRMESAFGAAECAWWRRHLADVDDLRPITDKPRPQAQSFDGDSVTFTIPSSVSGALEDMARQSGASPFMVWTALFAIVLGRCSGQKRFAIGGSLAGRTRPETESLIGFLVNNLVIKIDNDPGRTFREHLRSVQESVLASYAHGEYPFQLIAQSLGGRPDLSRNPIYQATLTYQNYQHSGGSLEGLSLSGTPMPILSTHVDLDLIAWPTDDGVACCLLYATDLFLRETAEAFGQALATLARHVAENPDTTLARMFRNGMLPDISRRPPSILVGNEVGYDFLSPWDRLLAQAERIPDATALVIGEGGGAQKPGGGRGGEAPSVTFSRLAAMSSLFADALNGRGVGIGKRTVILSYTGVELFVAMFAVWHRNGAWLLVDPDIPKARLLSILNEAAPDSVITTPGILEQFWLEDANALPGCLHLLPEWTRMPPGAGKLRPIRPEPEDIAMFFCTSGSTGSPKTAPCTHDAVSKRLSWEMDEYPCGEKDLGCLKSSVSYADFFYEAFVPVLSGVPLLLLGHSPALDVQHLMQQMELHGVTKMVAVPSLLKIMHRVSQGFAGRLQSLRFIRTSGEPMPTRLAESIVAAIPGVTLYSVYGSLEMHNPTAYRYLPGRSQVESEPLHLPAGRPLPGRAVALLDEYQLPVPWGEQGELYAGGWGLTPGYLSGERADSFPVLDIGGQTGRWYRSGDMGHVDGHGRLHVSGRKDFQIKVRGVRIEPDDVEGVMLRFPQVSEAKIAAWEDADGNQRLHGFVILDSATAPAKRAALSGELRSFLFEALPAVMVPDHITVLEDWPKTSTGKTHLAQLKEAFARQSAMADRLETRRYRGVEEAVAGIWRTVLGGAPLPDVRTTFFVAGGNSLLLITLHNELQTSFRQEFPLSLLFQNPTIESQALFLENNAGARIEAARSDAPRGRSALLARRGMSRG